MSETDQSNIKLYPHVVFLSLNNLYLFNLTSKHTDSLHPKHIEIALQQILSRHHINVAHVDTRQGLKTLASKLKYMHRQLRNVSRSGFRRDALFKKWKHTDYNLSIPHCTGSPTKQQVNIIQEELSATQSTVTHMQQQLDQAQGSNNELKRKIDRLTNPTKKKLGERGRAKHKVVQLVMLDTPTEGWKPISVKFRDEFDEEVVICLDSGNEIPKNDADDDIDRIVFILDQYNIPNRGYHELAQSMSSIMPAAGKVIKRRHSLNSGIEIKEISGDCPGVYTSLTNSLILKLSEPKRANLIKDGVVRIKLSGDGTRITCKQQFVNLSYTLVDEATSMSEHGNYLLAIAKCKEDNVSLKSAIHDLIQEFDTLSCVTINGKEIKIDKYLGGDLKYLNQILGIAGFASNFSCLWCHCRRDDRFDMSKSWSMTDTKEGARTIEGIIQCSHKRANDQMKYNCIEEPVFQSVPIHKVIPDTLHLCLRIGDQLVGHIISYLRRMDNIEKCSMTMKKLSNAKHIHRFQVFIHDVVGIYDWKFFIGKRWEIGIPSVPWS
ncbi:uncharacterized protein [Apostichopus japonicus]|uniref:uncharacterized protein n=1 Tax=Stichopus japonicus TaxID=307972 RepID=UPI003AB402C9